MRWGAIVRGRIDMRTTLDRQADAAYIYEHTDAVGFIGASSIERLAAEPAITETTAAFKKLRLRPR